MFPVSILVVFIAYDPRFVEAPLEFSWRLSKVYSYEFHFALRQWIAKEIEIIADERATENMV